MAAACAQFPSPRGDPLRDQGQFRRQAPRRRLCARHPGAQRGHAARPARRPRRGRRARSPPRSAEAQRFEREAAAIAETFVDEGDALRRLLLVGLGGKRDDDGALRAGRRRADRAAADLGRDQAGGRPRRPRARRPRRPRGSPSARRRAAGATTSTAPSSAASRSRRSRKWSSSAPARAPRRNGRTRRRCSPGSTSPATWSPSRANIIYPESFVERCREALEGARRRVRGARREGDGASSAWAPCSASPRARSGRRGCSSMRWNGAASRAEAGRPRRQGHHLRHRRHLDQAGRSAWKR